MPNTTANYQLNQWEPEDNFLRTDFNADNAKIDAALAGLAQAVSTAGVVTGSYTGDGTASRTISLGFHPTAVLLETAGGYRGGTSNAYGGLFLRDKPLNSTTASITSTGFQVTNDSKTHLANHNGVVYYYIAFK